MMNILSFVCFVFVLDSVFALSAVEWRSQSIYHLLTDRFARTDGTPESPCDLKKYCGGTWKGIVRQLDYIQGMGFTAIWISPIVDQLEGHSADGSSYHGYWAQNIEKVNYKFGTEADLIALSNALHARGMYLMVDVVTNHMAYLGAGNQVDYSGFVPFNDKRYFHDYCHNNYSTVAITQTCWMGSNTVSLPDLRTEDTEVVNIWSRWIKEMVFKYKIDGIRLDSAQQVDRASLKSFESAAGVYVMGEVFNGDPKVICSYQNELSGVLNFPNYFWIMDALKSTAGNMNNLASGINTMKTSCRDTTTLGSFLESHDRPRFTSYTADLSLAKNAVSFMMFADGIPIVYYGLEQRLSGNGIISDENGVPSNRQALWELGYDNLAPLYAFIRTLNIFRKHVFSSPEQSSVISRRTTQHNYAHQHGRFRARSSPQSLYAAVIHNDEHTIVMKRGDSIGVYSNLGADGKAYSLLLSNNQTGFAARTRLVEVLSCVVYTTDDAGDLTVPMEQGLPKLLYPEEKLKKSELCEKEISIELSIGASTTTSTTTRIITASYLSFVSEPTPTCSSVPITFNLKLPNVDAPLYAMDNPTIVKIVGEQVSLGVWKPENAVPLSKQSSSVWDLTLDFLPGTRVVYNFIKLNATGGVMWEGGPNRVVNIPSSDGCAVKGRVVDHMWGI